MVLCFIGTCGALLKRNMWIALIFCLPLFFLATALTGSRSGMLLCCMTLLAYVIIYLIYYRKTALGDATGYISSHPAVLLIAIGIGFIVIFISIDWQPVRRSTSIFSKALESPMALITGGEGSPRSQLWSKAVQNAGNQDTREAIDTLQENSFFQSVCSASIMVVKTYHRQYMN